jgi:hypothetical protein
LTVIWAVYGLEKPNAAATLLKGNGKTALSMAMPFSQEGNLPVLSASDYGAP